LKRTEERREEKRREEKRREEKRREEKRREEEKSWGEIVFRHSVNASLLSTRLEIPSYTGSHPG